MPNLSLLDLHLSQLGKTLERAQYNNYSSSGKELYQQKLLELFDKLVLEFDPTKIDEAQRVEYLSVVNFIFKSLEFLDNSTINLIPFELIECFNTALEDWTRTGEQYIIVTSLVNRYSGFGFDPYLANNDAIYDFISAAYGIDFNHRLVQITIPKTLSRDYLACVIGYHELGHFVDVKYAITDPIVGQIFDDGYISSLKDLEYYFPFLNSPRPEATKRGLLESHLKEYFADIFAAQYSGECTIELLMYHSRDSGAMMTSHPAADLRKRFVAEFIAGNRNNLQVLFDEALMKLKLPKLTIRYSVPSDEDLLRKLPIEIQSSEELHGVLPMAWNVWNDKRKALATALGYDEGKGHKRVYTILNNLVEKSIGNYIVTRSWRV